MGQKTVIFICGTNCTGKTSVAKAIQQYFGGISKATSDTTYCVDRRVAFAGRYKAEAKHGGVDSLSRTDILGRVVTNAFQTADFVFCEGSFLDTFGQNLCNAIFAGQKCLYVFLYCNRDELARRNKNRLSNPNKDKKREGVIDRMMNKQRRVLASAKKFASIGVPVISIDSAKIPTEGIVSIILERIGL